MIADHLLRYYEAFGEDPSHAVIRSIVIDGHEVAWMRYQGTVKADLSGQGREGEEYVGRQLHCECDFAEGVGWRMKDDGPVKRGDAARECIPRQAAVHLRHLELRKEYRERFDSPLTQFDDLVPKVILDLIGKVKAGEFLEDGNGAAFYGGFFYFQTVAAILDFPVKAVGEIVDRMVADKRISLEGAVVRPYADAPPPEWEESFKLVEKGWTGTASLPKHPQMPQEWKLEVFKPDGEPAYDEPPGLPLTHEPRFGPDTEDVSRAETKLKQLIKEAKSASAD